MAKNKNKKKAPREVVDVDDYFMGMAFWTATRSRDPHRQEGAVIVSQDGHIISAEPNGIPDLIKTDDFSWERVERLDYVERAIPNALWAASSSGQLWGRDSEQTIYVTAFPSKRCMRAIIRAKLEKVVWFPLHEKLDISEISDKETEAVKKLATLSKVGFEEYKGNLNWMRDQLAKFEAVGIFK
jgi:dCMP deaminase